jgi:tRNA pseudouridine32 synthase/23S rRNA pseudouridine746 synthase
VPESKDFPFDPLECDAYLIFSGAQEPAVQATLRARTAYWLIVNHRPSPLPPPRDGVGASTVQLPQGPWSRVLDFLVEQFPGVGEQAWRSRLARGLVLDARSQPLAPDSPYRAGGQLYYYRELQQEIPVPFEAELLYQDEQLLVADKPHFLPVVPAGRHLQETLLLRLRRRLDLPELAPLHRIDRGTAGLVLFSVNERTRGRYQALFARRAVEKVYEALAPHLPGRGFPLRHRSRLEAGEPFFLMREAAGEPNSETGIEIAERRGALDLYRLRPVTGRKHQLRVHLAALGAPILNDDFYPVLSPADEADFSRPLQLLARSLEFRDPLDGRIRRFESRRQLLESAY